MTRPISVGDLVMVVRACCDKTVRTPVFTVSDFWKPFPKERCIFCKKPFPDEHQASDRGGGEWFAYPLSWLKRIDPLPESETIQHNEEVGA